MHTPAVAGSNGRVAVDDTIADELKLPSSAPGPRPRSPGPDGLLPFWSRGLKCRGAMDESKGTAPFVLGAAPHATPSRRRRHRPALARRRRPHLARPRARLGG